MKIKLTVAALIAWILCAVVPLVAHHTFKSEFDTDRPLHLEGKITQLDLQNPHVYFHVEVTDSKGQTANWRVELVSPNDLSRLGMTRGMIGIGSDIVVDGFTAKTADRNMGAMEFTLKSTGKTFSLSEIWKRWELPSNGTRPSSKVLTLAPSPPVRDRTPAK